jgi:hypothetical protein
MLERESATGIRFFYNVVDEKNAFLKNRSG